MHDVNLHTQLLAYILSPRQTTASFKVGKVANARLQLG